MEERLQKLIAAAGLCSRRKAEEWLAAGRVLVNGKTATVGASADAERDEILVDGRPLVIPTEKRYLMLNKPRGYVCAMHDGRGRPTVAQLVRGCGARVVPVGRLDMDSEGLLLMTNDGAWMQRILHPRYEVDKEYRVTVVGRLDGAAERLSRVAEVGGEPIRPARVELLRRDARSAVLSVTIHEGKNRQIRRMCGGVGLRVRELRRVREHTLELGGLPAGRWRELTPEEVRAFDLD